MIPLLHDAAFERRRTAEPRLPDLLDLFLGLLQSLVADPLDHLLAPLFLQLLVFRLLSGFRSGVILSSIDLPNALSCSIFCSLESFVSDFSASSFGSPP
jgi:hypothetical protein